MIQLKNISFVVGKKIILHPITLTFQGPKFIAIIGPNGAGKSTLLKCMAGVSSKSSGELTFFDQTEKLYSKKQRAKMIGYVPQHFQQSFPMKVKDYIMLGRKPYIQWSPQSNDHTIVEEKMTYLRLQHLRDYYVDELSGGERQRVAIARALVQQPSILMLDEPISALDINHQIQVLKTLKELSNNEHLVLVVLHDLELAARFADGLILMNRGRIHAVGTPAEVLTKQHLQDVYAVRADVKNTNNGLSIYVVDIEEKIQL